MVTNTLPDDPCTHAQEQDSFAGLPGPGHSNWVLDAAPISVEDTRRDADLVVVALVYAQRVALLAALVEAALAARMPVLLTVEVTVADDALRDASARWATLLRGTSVRLRMRRGWIDVVEQDSTPAPASDDFLVAEAHNEPEDVPSPARDDLRKSPSPPWWQRLRRWWN